MEIQARLVEPEVRIKHLHEDGEKDHSHLQFESYIHHVCSEQTLLCREDLRPFIVSPPGGPWAVAILKLTSVLTEL